MHDGAGEPLTIGSWPTDLMVRNIGHTASGEQFAPRDPSPGVATDLGGKSMSDWIRRAHAIPEGWHQPGRALSDHSPMLRITLCGLAWSIDEPIETSARTEPGLDQRCPDCRRLTGGA